MTTVLPPSYFGPVHRLICSLLLVVAMGISPRLAAQVVWFHADALTGVTNGGGVTLWPDASGNGNNATQPATSQQPTLVTNAMNGLPVVRFNAASSTWLTFPRAVSNDFTFIFVYQSRQGLGTATAFFDGAGLVNGEVGGVQNDFGTCLNANGQIIFGTGNPDTSINSTGGFNDGRPHVVTCKRTMSSGSLTLYVDGSQVATATAGTQSLTAPPRLVLGAQQTLLNFLTGDLAEVLVYNTALSDPVRQAEENSLIDKYGIQPAGSWPRVMIPTLNTNQTVVAVATPQEYGAKGDGVTDDSAAFQSAMNAVYNQGGPGGGIIFVPAANYAFYTNLVIPQGVTLHGDWQDWTTGTNGLMGTTFKICFGAGQTNGAPFIFMSPMSCLRGINFWYPDQNARAITNYPYTVQINGDCVLQDIVLVNSYQGILGIASAHSSEHLLSTVIGSPLFMGISLDFLADISHTEDLRFSPDTWAVSGLTNAPLPGDPYAAWMRANGEAMRLYRVDGELSLDTHISGYHVGIEANVSTNGSPGATFYDGCVSNCATALLAQAMPSQSGLQFTRFTLDGDTAVMHNSNSDATISFSHCNLIGRAGPAAYVYGPDWHSWVSFQNCTVSNALQLAGPGVFNVVDSALYGRTQCIVSASATRAAFTGCVFSPGTNIINYGVSSNVLMDTRSSFANPLPIVDWTNVANDIASRKPARTNLFVVTQWGASGNGASDDTAAIQSALNAAGTNGGGIVYLPPGKYHLTNTLVVPSGVELRGVHEMRSGTGSWTDGHAKASVLEPYGGQGTTNGPPAVALLANSGIVGVNFNYEPQGAACIPFPATIQGRGGNVYILAVVCPNDYEYVDFDTYTCTNHLIYTADGWSLERGFVIGNGSSGTIIDNQGNPSYWVVNNDTQTPLGSGITAVNNFAATNLVTYALGNCRELLIKDFCINLNTFLDAFSENGVGPQVIGLGTCCDGSVRGYVLDSAGPASVQVVNTTMAIFSIVASDLTNQTVAVLATTNFDGSARFFNSALFAEPFWDFVISNGDVGFDQVHMLNHAFNGSAVHGGALHLVNNGAYITYNGASNFPPYTVHYDSAAGGAGRIQEEVGGYAYNGYARAASSASNAVNAWMNYALANYGVMSQSNQFAALPAGSDDVSVVSATGSAGITLTWPVSNNGDKLFASSNLGPNAIWSPAATDPVLSANAWTANLLITNAPQMFFRLQSTP